MDHVGPVLGAVRADVGHVEPFGQVEVDLHRRQLPLAADGVAGVDVDLRDRRRRPRPGRARRPYPVRSTASIERPFGVRPPLVVAGQGLVRPGRDGHARRLPQPEGAVQVAGELDAGVDLVDDLVLAAEDVAVVLGEPAGPEHPVDDAGALVAVDGAELGDAHRQLAVRPRARPVRQDVERAVHGLQAVRRGSVIDVHPGVHQLAVVLEVPRDAPEVLLGDVRGVDRLVAALQGLGPDPVLHLLADDGAVRQEDREAGAELLGLVGELELAAELAVVALAWPPRASSGAA